MRLLFVLYPGVDYIADNLNKLIKIVKTLVICFWICYNSIWIFVPKAIWVCIKEFE